MQPTNKFSENSNGIYHASGGPVGETLSIGLNSTAYCFPFLEKKLLIQIVIAVFVKFNENSVNSTNL